MFASKSVSNFEAIIKEFADAIKGFSNQRMAYRLYFSEYFK